ncbi:MAG TPA: glycosyl hydrolase family 18 protein [Candidatus Dormibacteraeota bacterium]|nr:glycosyl hydrolase family 18 protein [Candidatus Dormibacteraeota bacterium]
MTTSITCLALVAASLPVAPAIAAGAGVPTGRERPSIMQADDATHRHQAFAFPASGSAVMPLLPERLSSRAASPRTTVYNGGGLYREVFGFAPYWELASGDLSDVQYDKLSTVAYFGLTITASGAIQTVDPTTGRADPGFAGWNSSALTAVINSAHSQGDRVVLVVKSFTESAIYHVVSNQAAGAAAISNIVAAARARGVDGVNVDFEGYVDNANYPNISPDYSAWVGRLSNTMRGQWPGSFLTVDAYASAASSDASFMRVDTIAPSVDAFFIMGYDFDRNRPTPDAPLAGPYTFTDTIAVDQFLARVGGNGSKVILGVPYYGYKYSTQNNSFEAPLSGNCSGGSVPCSDPYAAVLSDLSCGSQQLSVNWDAASSTPWAAWYSPAKGDPCGNHNSWRELYYDNAASIGAKYDLVTNRNIRGAGMWALGYDHGSGDLWSVIKDRFQVCPPVTVNSAGPVVGAMGSDAGLWVTRGGGFECLGGVISSAPAIASLALSGGGGLPVFVATAPNHDLWVRTGNSRWQQLDTSGVHCVDNPAIAVSGVPGTLTVHVACAGGDGTIWYGTATPADGAVPQTQHSTWRSLGGIVVAGPALDLLGGEPTVYGLGTDGRIWMRTLASPPWSSTAWQCIGHPAVADSGGVARFACQGSDGALWYANNDGSGWSTATSAGGRLVDGPGIAANGNTVTFYVEGRDQAVYRRTLQPGGNLDPGWGLIGGRIAHGVGATYN